MGVFVYVPCFHPPPTPPIEGGGGIVPLNSPALSQTPRTTTPDRHSGTF